ncbi:Diadenosine tetraphosphate (Ap4A) hydrolase [Noviherbaspirillum humi]|uniref:Diadenosine tetraphosphate (Ap4A) hydrolase n=1 Tax=Noviherbaspirillum humi TaxID=1688639 RepID=A0A239CNM3_9BURK|nr:HIT family protein [Noviherbaspirillum humi]SNS20943.1 Diadenosine tetraphosphate (Ap4A) hydrolase [Noviherbaspirillum humi]
MTGSASCELCRQPGGEVLVQRPAFRVVLVDEPGYPGFCRVIRQAHAAEMTDLSPAERSELMDTVWRVEEALREVMQPAKINLASFGNMVPHVHWHLIPRFADDQHFPAPTWAAARRAADPERIAARTALLPALRDAIIRRFS